MKASSGSEGFFQETPKLDNQFREDAILQRLFQFYLPSSVRQGVAHDLDTFGSLVVTPHCFSLVADAERNPPTLSTHTVFGVPRSVLHTNRGWRELQAIGIQQGIVAIPYEATYGHHSRMYQFLKYHLWTPSSAFVTCPSAMTDGAAKLLSRHLDGSGSKEAKKVFREAYCNLTSRDPRDAWTSGQWMTERSGGSDVRGTETVALRSQCGATDVDANGLPLGPYTIGGFKWFSSATDSHMAVLLAQTPSGLSAFFAPMRRRCGTTSSKASQQDTPTESELNGISIQRLKPKLGTRAVPTAELELKGMRAWLLGTEGAGVREIATVLNITRVHTGMGSMGLWGRGLAISRAFARVRKVDGGKALSDMPAHLKTMAMNEVNYAAMMHLGFFVVMLLGISEQPDSFQSGTSSALVSTVDEAAGLLRLLTAVMKAQCSKMAIFGLQECMESLGGVGYLEDEQEFNIARLYRDCNVNSIWEGTTDVMATDVTRVMRGREGENVRNVFKKWAQRIALRWKETTWTDVVRTFEKEITGLDQMWTGPSTEELKFRGRELLEMLAWIVATISLIEDARSDGCEVATEIARRWAASRSPNSFSSNPKSKISWSDESAWDKKIAFYTVYKAEHARL